MSLYSICLRATLHILVAIAELRSRALMCVLIPEPENLAPYYSSLLRLPGKTYSPPIVGLALYYIPYRFVLAFTPRPVKFATCPNPPVRQHQEPIREFSSQVNLSTLLCIAPGYMLTQWAIKFPPRTRIFMFKAMSRRVS